MKEHFLFLESFAGLWFVIFMLLLCLKPHVRTFHEEKNLSRWQTNFEEPKCVS
jgi:hypothetical protein